MADDKIYGWGSPPADGQPQPISQEKVNALRMVSRMAEACWDSEPDHEIVANLIANLAMPLDPEWLAKAIEWLGCIQEAAKQKTAQ